MKNPFLKLVVLATGVSLLAQSCSGPTYVESTPPPQPVYTQAPPPPPAPAYTEPAPQDAPPPAVSYQSFYDELSPYGQWVNTPNYGYVWVPSAGPDFQPYGTAGHWVLTNYGWTWVSDYSWGWAPFHYGSWEFDGMMGWYWIPGYQWSPAWVSWRSTPGYYGWAPLGPTYRDGGYASYNAPPERYVFVSANYMNSPNVYNYYEPRAQYGTYYSRSTVVTNTYYDNDSHNTYYAGPPREEVERATGVPVRPVSIVQTSSPERGGVAGNEVRMFRPSVQQPTATEGVKPTPPRVFEKTEVTPITQRPVLTKPNQPRVVPFKLENTQHAVSRPAEPNKLQTPVPEQKAPVPHPQIQQQQTPIEEVHPSVQTQSHPATQPQQLQVQPEHPVVQQQPAAQTQPHSATQFQQPQAQPQQPVSPQRQQPPKTVQPRPQQKKKPQAQPKAQSK